MKDTRKLEAEHFLTVWGAYTRRNKYENLGYKKENIIGRCMREGAGASQSTVPVIYDIPDDVEIMDKIMMMMPEDMRAVLECRFVKRMKDQDGAEYSNLSKSGYRNRVEQGISFVMAGLTFQQG